MCLLYSLIIMAGRFSSAGLALFLRPDLLSQRWQQCNRTRFRWSIVSDLSTIQFLLQSFPEWKIVRTTRYIYINKFFNPLEHVNGELLLSA